MGIMVPVMTIGTALVVLFLSAVVAEMSYRGVILSTVLMAVFAFSLSYRVDSGQRMLPVRVQACIDAGGTPDTYGRFGLSVRCHDKERP